LKEKRVSWSGFWSGLIWFVVGTIWMFFVQLFSVGLFAGYQQAKTGADLTEDQINAFMLDGDVLSVAFMLILPTVLAMLAFVVKVRRKQPLFSFLGFRIVSKSVLLTWCLYAIVLVTGMLIADRIFDRPFVPEWAQTAYEATGNLWFFSLSIIVLGPISEELLYRGYVLRVWSESRLGPAISAVLLSVMWAVIHLQYDLYDMAGVFFVGLLLCVSRFKSNSILPAIAIHIGFNAVGQAMLLYQNAT